MLHHFLSFYHFLHILAFTVILKLIVYVFFLRYHLQALRHLCVLAAEPRLLVPVDVDTLEPCYALLDVTYKVHKTRWWMITQLWVWSKSVVYRSLMCVLYWFIYVFLGDTVVWRDNCGVDGSHHTTWTPSSKTGNNLICFGISDEMLSHLANFGATRSVLNPFCSFIIGFLHIIL